MVVNCHSSCWSHAEISLWCQQENDYTTEDVPRQARNKIYIEKKFGSDAKFSRVTPLWIFLMTKYKLEETCYKNFLLTNNNKLAIIILLKETKNNKFR